jgi:hypothetical protein
MKFYKYRKGTIIITLIITILINFGRGQTTDNNLLQNGDFSLTNLTPNASYQYFPSHITGWNCTLQCEIDDCLLLNAYF